jgi:hypothetical protein
MKSAFARFVCRILIAGMIVVPWQAQAGVIGTDQAVAAAQAQAARASVAGFVNRSEVADRLQALGLSPQAASERVAALSDTEVAGLAGRIDALPAGGYVGVLPILVLIFLVWRFNFSDQAKAEAAKPKPKPAPAPEKK